jgi:uncharacterized protein YjbI with pentapeptide repeats
MQPKQWEPKAPSIPAIGRLEPGTADELAEEARVARRAFTGIDIRERWAHHLVIEESRLVDSTMSGADLEHMTLTHVDAAGTDFSNAQLHDSRFARVALRACRLTGTRLNQATLQEVVLAECTGELMQLQSTKCKRVVFSGCRLRGALLGNVTFEDVRFEGCDLREVDLLGARFSRVDLRGSELDGIRVSADQLRGVIVTADQALYLARSLGLDIRD